MPALRRARMRLHHHPAIHDPSVQIRPDQPDHSSILDAPAGRGLEYEGCADTVRQTTGSNPTLASAPRASASSRAMRLALSAI
jgi:hypothetical protein